jgi:hypothetical protein
MFASHSPQSYTESRVVIQSAAAHERATWLINIVAIAFHRNRRHFRHGYDLRSPHTSNTSAAQLKRRAWASMLFSAVDSNTSQT